MIAFFINDNPKSPSYKLKEKTLLHETWFYFDKIKIITERDVNIVLIILKVLELKMLYLISIREFEDYSPTEISEFILKATTKYGVSIHIIEDKLRFDMDNADKIYEVIFAKYKEHNPIS